MRFQALTWSLQDKRASTSRVGDDWWTRAWKEAGCIVHICGRDECGRSIHVAVVDHVVVIYADCTIAQFHASASAAQNFGNAYESWWVHDVCMVDREVYQGFRNGRKKQVVQITCAGRGVAVAIGKQLQSCDITTYNTNVDALTTFFHRTGIKPCGWIEIKEFAETEPEDYNGSRCDCDFLCRTQDLCASECASVAPFRIASFDIEALPTPRPDGTFEFPSGKRPECQISCICIWIKTLQTDTIEKHAFAFAPVDGDYMANHAADVTIHAYDGERAMLLAFVAWVRSVSPDIYTGWNILNFDWAFLNDRCVHHGVDLRGMGKYDVYSTKLKNRTLSTQGGHHEFKYWDIAGAFSLDEFVVVKRDHKLEQYSLNECGKHFLGVSKIDLAPKEIYRQSLAGPRGLAVVTAYCDRDVQIPLDIMEKLNSLVKSMMFANIALVPIDDLLLRGANAKTMSLIANKTSQRNWIISDEKFQYNKLAGKYSGATVLDPVTGLHKEPVATLDFASLYPSIVISQNLDPHTFVDDPAELGSPDIETKTFEWDDEKTGHHYRYMFVVRGGEALVPQILKELWVERKAAKRRMKSAASLFEKGIHDGTQLAIKLMMNAIYGFFGAKDVGKMPNLPIAMVITYCGRFFIEETQKLVLCKYAHFDNVPPPEERPADIVCAMMKSTLDELEERKIGGVQNVYGDTDSVFIKWDIPAELTSKRAILEHVFALAETASRDITDHLNAYHCPNKGTVELEFEKVYYWLIMYAKKRYAGLMWTAVDHYDYIDVKGLQVVRRDNPNFVKTCMKSSLDAVLIEENVERAVTIVKTALQRMVDRSMPLEELQITKKLNSNYKCTEPAHAGVARRMRQRGHDVTDGDRVSYVFPISSAGELQNERAEDPNFVRENGMYIDWVFYVEHTFQKGICELLEPVVPSLNQSVIHPALESLRTLQRRQDEAARRERVQKKQRVKPITCWFQPQND